MHAWHDVHVDDHLIETACPVDELDKDARLLKLDRVLYIMHPADAFRIVADALDIYRRPPRGEITSP